MTPAPIPRRSEPLPGTGKTPPRGLPGAGPERFCARTMNDIVGPGEVLCGKPASHHIIWDEETPGGDVETGCCCVEHAAEVKQKWQPIGFHVLGPDCGMPGSKWIVDEDTCRSEDVPTAEPVRAIAQEVSA